MRPLLLIAAAVAVIDCRVTFSYSEVLQQSDLNSTNKAPFRCDYDCLVYTDLLSTDLHINNNTHDFSLNLLTDFTGRVFPLELERSKNYTIDYKGVGKPPNFVFYVVEKIASYRDTPVFLAKDCQEFLSNRTFADRFTVLSSGDATPRVRFNGEFSYQYPRIYATGYDSVSGEAGMCSTVYQSRWNESSPKSVFGIPSPIFTVVNNNTPDPYLPITEIPKDIVPSSSAVYMSPGYTGCSYTLQQVYSSNVKSVQDSFSAEVQSLDFLATVYIPTEKEALRITMNGETISLYNYTVANYGRRASRFNVGISWTRQSPTSSFAVQFDMGVDVGTQSTTAKAPSTTSIAAQTALSLLCLTTFIAMLSVRCD